MAKTPKEQLGVDLEEVDRATPPEPVVEAPEGEARPDWLPEKFKTEADFVASYSNLETELRTRAETEKQMQARLDQLTEAISTMQVPTQPTNVGDVQAQLMASYENDPLGTIALLAKQISDSSIEQRLQQLQMQQAPQIEQQQRVQAELVADTADKVLSARFPDWDTYGEKVGELIAQNPGLLPDQDLLSLDATTARLESLYKQVKYDDLSKAIEEGRTQDFVVDQMKRNAQTISGHGQRPGERSEQDDKIDRLVAAAKETSWASRRAG